MKLTDKLHYFLCKFGSKRREKQRKNRIRKDYIAFIADVVCSESDDLIYDSKIEHKNISFVEAKQICYDLKIPFFVDIKHDVPDTRYYIYLDRIKLRLTK